MSHFSSYKNEFFAWDFSQYFKNSLSSKSHWNKQTKKCKRPYKSFHSGYVLIYDLILVMFLFRRKMYIYNKIVTSVRSYKYHTHWYIHSINTGTVFFFPTWCRMLWTNAGNNMKVFNMGELKGKAPDSCWRSEAPHLATEVSYCKA